MKIPKKAIWIDLDNSPHVPLFVPIVRHYRERGVEVIVTARQHAQTIDLLNLAGLDGTFSVIGRHYGKSKLNKIRGLISRTLDLAFLGRRDIAVAVSHGSRSMVLAALGLRIPVVTMYDYEFTETRLFNKFSDKVLVPEAITDAVLDDIGLGAAKRVKYPGIKEEIYVSKFRPDPNFRRSFFLTYGRPDAADKIIVTLRPPATTANYHAKKSDVLLDAILRFLLQAPEVFTVVVPRTREQADDIRTHIANLRVADDQYLILENAVDGLDLAFASDLVISGGGTMNREAVLLGVPVYSFFAGNLGALDARMERDGLITFIRDADDVAKINLSPRDRREIPKLTDRVERFVIGEIDSFLK